MFSNFSPVAWDGAKPKAMLEGNVARIAFMPDGKMWIACESQDA
jgi:hypothetical protein